MPDTDIWLVDIIKKDGKYTCKNPLNITNKNGYDNQPSFSNDDKGIYFVSVKEPNQTEIFFYSIKNKTTTPLRQTRESEYSPTQTIDAKFITSVVVLADSSQQLFNYDVTNILAPEAISKNAINTDSVGYFTWLSKDTILYYKLTEPHSLRAWDLKTNKDAWICNNPTRAFKKIKNTQQFIYGIKDSTSVQFRIYNPTLKESKFFTSYPSLNEDFIWNNELGLIKSENADLLRYNEQTKTWDLLFSFSNLDIKKITRFNFDSKNKRLTFVSNL